MKFLATDFDDTLYFHDGQGIRKKDEEAIRRFQQAGNLFGLNTGRSVSMYSGIEDMVADKVKFDFKIFANGSCIEDQNGNIVYERFLPEDFIHYLMENVNDIPVSYHHRSGVYCTKPHDAGVEGIICIYGDYSKIPDLKIYEVSIDYTLPGAEEIIEDLAKFPGVVSLKNSKFADFNAEGTSKGIGLDLAAELFGFSHEDTAAIGDSFNDIPMISQAEDGFTFHQSAQEVRDAADYVTDGIWEAVDILMGKSTAEQDKNN